MGIAEPDITISETEIGTSEPDISEINVLVAIQSLTWPYLSQVWVYDQSLEWP